MASRLFIWTPGSEGRGAGAEGRGGARRSESKVPLAVCRLSRDEIRVGEARPFVILATSHPTSSAAQKITGLLSRRGYPFNKLVVACRARARRPEEDVP